MGTPGVDDLQVQGAGAKEVGGVPRIAGDLRKRIMPR